METEYISPDGEVMTREQFRVSEWHPRRAGDGVIVRRVGDVGLSVTDESHGEDADMNNIVRRLMRGGELPPFDGMFADVSEVPDFEESLHRVRVVQASFMALEPELRAKFDNDPAKFLEFRSENADWRSQLVEWGFLAPPPAGGEEAPAKSAGGSEAPAGNKGA